MPRHAIIPDRLAKPVGPFSPAVSDGQFVFVSGHVAQDPATGALIKGDVSAQTEQLLRNLEATLAAAGKTFDDVVKVSVFLTNMSNFSAMNAVYARFFAEPYPARTTIGVAALPLGAAVEMDLIAR